MLNLKEWFSKYGVIAALAAAALLALLVMGAISVLFVSGTNNHADSQTTTMAPAAIGPAISVEETQELIRGEISEQKRQDREARESWRAMVPLIVETHGNQFRTTVKSLESVTAMFLRLHQAIDADAFAEAACGMESTVQALNGDDAHYRWLLEQFRELVLDEKDVAGVVNQQLQQLHEVFSESDADLMLALNLDASLLPSLTVPIIEFEPLDQRFHRSLKDPGSFLTQSWGESAISWGAANLITSVMSGLTQDDSQPKEESFLGMLAGHAANLAVSEVVEQAVSNSVPELSAHTETWAKAYARGLETNPDGRNPSLDALLKLFTDHQTALIESLINTTHVERDWAIDFYNDYASEMSAATNTAAGNN